MINTLKKYMVVDLLMLAVIGFVLELLCVMFGGNILTTAPSATISLLIMFVAVARWNLWGLILAPIMALATLVGGSLNQYETLSAVYDYKYYISILIGHLTIAVNVIFYKKLTTSKVIKNQGMYGLIAIDYVLFCGAQYLVYTLLCIASGPDMIQIPEGMINVQANGQTGFVSNLLGLIIIVVGSYVLKSQGIICNVKQKFIDDKKAAEVLVKDEDFRLNTAENEACGDESSQETNN